MRVSGCILWMYIVDVCVDVCVNVCACLCDSKNWMFFVFVFYWLYNFLFHQLTRRNKGRNGM